VCTVVAVVVRLMSGVYCGGCCSQVLLGDRFVVLCDVRSASSASSTVKVGLMMVMT
jgi:hypothetical protein